MSTANGRFQAFVNKFNKKKHIFAPPIVLSFIRHKISENQFC